MRRFLIGAAALLMLSCSVEDVEQVPSESGERVVFRGILSDADAENRTYIDSSVNLRWHNGDKVSVFTETSRNKWMEFLDDTGDTAGEFSEPKAASPFGTGIDIDANYAVYPYLSTNKLDAYTRVFTVTIPATQSYAEDSFGRGANVMTAVTESTEDGDLRFRNVGGYLHFRLYGEGVTVKSVVLTALGGQALSGKAKITHPYGGYPSIEFTSSQGNTLTINCPEGVELGTTAESATDFWFVLPPVKMSEGFSITVNDLYGGSWTKSTSAVITISRNKYRNVNPLLVTIENGGSGMGVGGWGEGSEDSGVAE